MSFNIIDVVQQVKRLMAESKACSVPYGNRIIFPYTEKPFKRLLESVLAGEWEHDEFRVAFVVSSKIGVGMWLNPNVVPEFKKVSDLPKGSLLGWIDRCEVHATTDEDFPDNKIYSVAIHDGIVLRASGITMEPMA